jgi:hypothetical protein
MHSISPVGGNQSATSSQVWAPKTSWRDTIHAHPYAAAMAAIAAGIAAATGVMWWLHVFQYESTDAHSSMRGRSRSALRLLERSSTFQ